MTRPVAEVVAKGLVRFDGQVLEIAELTKQLELTAQKINLKDEVISNLTSKVTNLETIIQKKDEQFNLERKKSEELLSELKGQKRTTFLYKVGTFIGIGSSLILLVR